MGIPGLCMSAMVAVVSFWYSKVIAAQGDLHGLATA